MGRISRSFQLIGQSWKVLMKDPELLVLPLLSGICIVIVTLSFIVPMGFLQEGAIEEANEVVVYGVVFLFYVVTYTLSFFFQAAVVAGATERMRGGDPTVGSSLRAAASRFPALLMWGVIAATVGMILKAIEERSGVVGKIVVSLLGAAWSLATFFMVPVLVMERLPVGQSFKHSWAIFKQTWGETVVGSLGIGLLTFLGMLVIGAIGFGLFYIQLEVVAIVTCIAGFLLLMLVSSALGGVYTAAMYRYATEGPDADTGFDAELLASAYRQKKK